VIRLLEDSGERAVRLREKSPFVSLLSDLGRGDFFKRQLSQLIE